MTNVRVGVAKAREETLVHSECTSLWIEDQWRKLECVANLLVRNLSTILPARSVEPFAKVPDTQSDVMREKNTRIVIKPHGHGLGGNLSALRSLVNDANIKDSVGEKRAVHAKTCGCNNRTAAKNISHGSH
jgi:hypothetical protein